MNIAITTVGTRGDLQPYIALGLGLKEAGHDVLVISAKNEEGLVRNYGLDFFALNVDIQKIMEEPVVQKMAKGDNPIKFMISHLRSSGELSKLMEATQHEIWNGCQGADIIIFHPGMPIGFFIAKELGKISILATPFPVIATKDYPAILFYPGPRLGTLYNKFTHFIFEKLFWTLTKTAIKNFWKKMVKSEMDFSVSPIRQQLRSAMPVLNGYSEIFFHSPKDWPANVHTTGSWLIDKEPAWEPDIDLVDFINNGVKPVFIGFGSMKDISTFRETIEIIVKALELANQRAVVGLGWNNVDWKKPIPENIFLVKDIPHSWLFPQMSVLVHHGGAGTTAAGLTAGKPTVIIPFNADQPAWGKRVFELGLGPKPIRIKKLTAGKLATAISYALDPKISARAEELGQKLRIENGVKQAVKIVDDFIGPETIKHKA